MDAPTFKAAMAMVEARGEARGVERASIHIAAGEVLDFHAFESNPWLSGEWAGESVRECLGLPDAMWDALEGDDLSDLCDVYENRADNAFWDALQDAGLVYDGI